jgi:tetratricopeptide (TPR) repeat protein
MSIAEPAVLLDVSDLRELYDRSLYLELYRRFLAISPLREWTSASDGVLRARLAHQLGAPRLSGWMLRRLRQQFPDHPEVRYSYTYVTLARSGPYKSWRKLMAAPDIGPDADDDIRGSWHALIGQVAAALRDFETAESWFRKAEAISPGNPWIQVCWSYLYEQEDRYDEALAAAQRSLEARPHYRAGVQAAGHLLSLLGRDAEAIELYQRALEVTESAPVAAQLFGLQIELRDWPAAQQSLDRYIELSPLMEKRVLQWVAAQRSELAYHRGEIAEAIEQAKLADTPYFKAIAENLERAGDDPSGEALLPVPFVRQHHVTCAPATLAAISRYWSMPADHVQVADEICYNGTTNHAEREWAQTHGWAVREFSVTEESAQQLIDRGVPFTVVTVEPGNAHLQAIIGYDRRRRTLEVRDPYFRNSGETLADKFIERYKAFGPRGMALVPAELSEKLADLDLPDAPLWDLLHEIDGALIKHRRDEAQEAYRQLLAQAPNHRLTHDARRRLAIYDFNPAEQLAAIEDLLKEFPDDDRLMWERLALMRFQTSQEERLKLLEERCQKPESHPIFWRQYAQELQQDARRHAEVEQLLIRAIRRWPSDPTNYCNLAHVRWDQRRFEEALELYRFAVCLGDKDEQLVRSYFSAATWERQTDVALRLLQDRFERYGKKSSSPARTLAGALCLISREAEALEVLENAAKLRPDDGELLLYMADCYLTASHENIPRATELIEQARSCSPRPQWLRAAAQLASAAGDPHTALAQWREVAELQPLATDAHHAVARLMAETQGRRAGLDYMAETCGKMPHHHALHELWIELLRGEPLEAREPVLRRVLAMAPDNAWVRRELADNLAMERKFDEAWEHTEIAGRLEPFHPSYPILRGKLFHLQGNIAEAKAELRKAIELSVDSEYAITELMSLCTTLAERREALLFVRDELVKQVTFGDGLLAFRIHAQGVLEGDELLAELQAALDARPDLWHAWSAVTLHLLLLERLDEALNTALAATERFPLQPRLWFDLSRVHRARLDFDAEQTALENALRVNPGWSVPLRAMCECLGRRRDFELARQFAERAVTHAPLDAINHVLLAEQLWRLEDREAAIARVRQALHVDPRSEMAWDYLKFWAMQMGQPEVAIDTARDLTVRRPGEARSWLILAKMLDGPQAADERFAALDKALELNPHSIEAHDLRAESLANARRFREALEACSPAVFDGHQPAELGWRAAWIEAQRGDERAAIERMQKVVAEEPNYYNAWSQLAEWTKNQQDFAGYLRAAEQLVRISPQYDVTLGFLGEARQLTGDLAGAREAYARAFELSPTYEFAGNNLFDLQLADNDLAGAAETMAVLREHNDTGFVIARDVQLAVRQKDLERGLQCLRKLCVTKWESRWPLLTAVRELRGAGAGPDVERILEQSLAQENCQPEVGSVWIELALARIDDEEDGDRGYKLALEQKLSGKKAHLHAWMRLADYYQERQELNDYLRCAQAMLRCDPNSEQAHGYVGEAKLLTNDRAGGIAALERAVELNPSYEFASNTLFDAYFQDRNLDAAARLVAKLDCEHPGSFFLSRKIQLSALRGQYPTAAGYLRELCFLPVTHAWPMANAVRALEEAGQARLAEETLWEALQQDGAQPPAGLHWGRVASERDDQYVRQTLPQLFARPDTGEQALHAWFEKLAKANRKDEIRSFIAEHRAVWMADVRLWGVVGWVATLIRDYRLANEVCSNWRDYSGVAPWMLVNAVEGFRAEKRHEEAVECSRHALSLPEDGGTHLHHLWLACDAAGAGQFDAAREHEQQIQPQRLDDDYSFLYTLVAGVLQMQLAPPQQRAEAFAAVRENVNAAYQRYRSAGIFQQEPARRAAFYAAVKRIAAIAGTLRAKLWTWRWAWSK